MHTGEGKTKNPGWPASRISYLTLLPFRNREKSVERELHFHRTAETKFLDNITIRSTESAPFILCCPIAIPKFQTILRGFIGIEHFGCIKCHFLAIEGHDVTCRIVGRFVLNVELRSHKAVLEVLVFHLERSSCVISPCTSPIRIDSNQIGRINTCTGTVGNDGADNLKLLLEMDGRLGTLIFYIAERTERNSIAYRTRPITEHGTCRFLQCRHNRSGWHQTGWKYRPA